MKTVSWAALVFPPPLTCLLSPSPAELLELRAQGQRDLQRLQHRPLLRLLLPAQRLGEAPPRLWADSRWGSLFGRGGAGRGGSSARGGCGQRLPPRRSRGGQPQRFQLGHGLALRHAGHARASGHGVPLDRRKGKETDQQLSAAAAAAATTSLQMEKTNRRAFGAHPQLPDTHLTSKATSISLTGTPHEFSNLGFKWSSGNPHLLRPLLRFWGYGFTAT